MTYLDATTTNNTIITTNTAAYNSSSSSSSSGNSSSSSLVTSFSSMRLKRWDGARRICTSWDKSKKVISEYPQSLSRPCHVLHRFTCSILGLHNPWPQSCVTDCVSCHDRIPNFTQTMAPAWFISTATTTFAKDRTSSALPHSDCPCHFFSQRGATP